MSIDNRDIKVSVLIPVFGVEKYIEKCARSLFEQTMTDGIEYIFVDDCTKDNSLKILDDVLNEYPDRKAQVRIIHHEKNFGLAEARVTGLMAAKGEYVIHCDSDDWVANNIYEILYNEAKRTDADIVGCDCRQVFKTSSIVRKQDFSLPQEKLVIELIKGDKIEAYLWNRLVRREFYMKGAYRADRGTTLLEDMAVTVPMHMDTDKVAYISQPLYFYRRTDEASMSSSMNSRNIRSALNVLQALYLYPMKNRWKTALIKRIRFFLFYRLMSFKSRNLIEWQICELPILIKIDLPISLFETISIWLVKHKFNKTQFVILIANKLFDLNWLKGKLFRRRIIDSIYVK